MEASEKPKKEYLTGSEAWLEAYKDFRNYCPKFRPEKSKEIGRDAACDNAYNALLRVYEHFNEFRSNGNIADPNGKLSGLETALARNLSLLTAMRHCGNRECGSCIDAYLNIENGIRDDIKKSRKGSE
ncbi:MAG: hypothetical protein QXU82_02635 [Candidatus Aenigmatarchaeota archaeon]